MTQEQYSQIEHLITKDIVYNTALLTAKYLKSRLAGGDADSKVLVVGNSGLLEEIKEQGLDAELLEVVFDGETEVADGISES